MINPSEDALTKTRKAGALARPLTPSAELAAIVGDEPLARTEIVKRVWDYSPIPRGCAGVDDQGGFDSTADR